MFRKQQVPSRRQPDGSNAPSTCKQTSSNKRSASLRQEADWEHTALLATQPIVNAMNAKRKGSKRPNGSKRTKIISRTTPYDLMMEMLGITVPTVQQKIMLTQLVRAWAPSTWRMRCSVWSRFKDWAKPAEPTPESAVTWLATQIRTDQTKHIYAKALMALFNNSVRKHSTAPLRLYTKALVASGALIPIKQAKPLTKDKVHRLSTRLRLQHKAPGAAIAVKLAYKICGRWMQTALLTPRMCPTIQDDMIVIAWGQTTKTSRNKPFSRAMYSVCAGDWTPEIAAYLRQAPPEKPLTTWDVTKINRVIRKMFGKGHSSHGVKRGAIEHLMKLVVQGKLTLDEVSVIAQHESVISTLRYAGNPTNMALALGTHRASSYL